LKSNIYYLVEYHMVFSSTYAANKGVNCLPLELSWYNESVQEIPISKFISNNIMKFCQTLNRIAVTVTDEIINYPNYHLTIIVIMTILLYSF